MYCPQCRGEYEEGFFRCSDCNVELVTSLRSEEKQEYVEMVTVVEGNSSDASVACATLTDAGIESWIRDEGIQSVFPSLGPAEVQVRVEDARAAKKALESDIQNSEYDVMRAESEERGSSAQGPLEA